MNDELRVEPVQRYRMAVFYYNVMLEDTSFRIPEFFAMLAAYRQLELAVLASNTIPDIDHFCRCVATALELYDEKSTQAAWEKYMGDDEDYEVEVG